MTNMKQIVCGFPDCGKSATADDECAGCHTFICSEHADAPWGKHDALDHRECSVCGEAGHFDGECDE